MENRYGTTSDMIIQEIDNNGAAQLLAIDSRGLYLTDKDRVDRMVADVNRYGVAREEVNRRLEDLGMDPLELFNANKHLIKTVSGTAKAKVNPIKASKRRM
ncbi:MAG: hypothetical protein MI863_02295 [Desulfobacterales bacterium]|nr:hypothetical protein [Desulfobacterales bacterium]